jgi:signal transduction histidine kinase
MRRSSSFRISAACAALGLVLAVLGAALVSSHRTTRLQGLDRTLDSTAGEKAALVGTELERAQALGLVTARIPAFSELYADEGSGATGIDGVAQSSLEINEALQYVWYLYPDKFVEAGYVDMSGVEDARVVGGLPAQFSSLRKDVRSWPSFAQGIHNPAGIAWISAPFKSPTAGSGVVAITVPVAVAGRVRAYVELELAMASIQRVLSSDIESGVGVVIVSNAGRSLTHIGVPFTPPKGEPRQGLASVGGWRLSVRRVPEPSIVGGPWFIVAASHPASTLSAALAPIEAGVLGLALALLVIACIGFWRARTGAAEELAAEHNARAEAERLTLEAERGQEALRLGLEREQEASEHLRALDGLRNSFLQAVSHELRTPLTSVLGFALTLGRSDLELSPEERQEFLARLSVNARKLERLLTDLLDVDRLSRGVMAPRLRNVDLGALAQRAADETEVGPRLLQVETLPLEIMIDGPKVERIIENLLRNAARHTPEGSRMWLRVRKYEGGALVVVEDDGPGVPDALKAVVFEAFRQGEHNRQHDPGTGIGLSLVASFAQLHGGRAWVQDREGGGASFRIYLPSGEEAKEANPPEGEDDRAERAVEVLHR